MVVLDGVAVVAVAGARVGASAVLAGIVLVPVVGAFVIGLAGIRSCGIGPFVLYLDIGTSAVVGLFIVGLVGGVVGQMGCCCHRVAGVLYYSFSLLDYC